MPATARYGDVLQRCSGLRLHNGCAQDMYAEVPVPASLEGSKSFDFLRRDLRRAGSLDGGGGYDRSVYGGGYDRSVHSGGASPAAGAYGSIYGGSHSAGARRLHRTHKCGMLGLPRLELLCCLKRSGVHDVPA